jgi:pilus assembly protein CpaB
MYTHDSAIRSEQADNVIGKRIMHEVNKGEALLASFIAQKNNAAFADLIKEGERAITFPVDLVSSMSGLLRPGNRIDLMLTLRAEKKLTRPLLRNVTVLATGDSIDNSKFSEKGVFQTITVSVSPKNASRITLARNVGTISVVLRSTKESSEYINDNDAAVPVTVNNLFGGKVKQHKKIKDVEIIIGG